MEPLIGKGAVCDRSMDINTLRTLIRGYASNHYKKEKNTRSRINKDSCDCMFDRKNKRVKW